MGYHVSGTDCSVREYRGRLYAEDHKAFSADAYTAQGWLGVAWSVLGWECELDADTEWSGCVRRTETVLAIMVGDDRVFPFERADLKPLAREDYCGVCGQVGCSHGGRTGEEMRP